MNEAYINDIFKHHPPKDEKVAKTHADIRELTRQLAMDYFDLIPESPERTLAIRRLQEAMMYGNAAIALYS